MSKNEYQELLKYVNNMNNQKGEKCLICHFPIKNKDLIELKCKHSFHKGCLNCNDKIIICPYCDFRTKNEELSKVKCQAIIKSGLNKGKICNRENCKIFKNIDKDEDIRCKFILKSGLSKGMVCNRINCKYHKKDINKFIIV
mgnify:CR=1 FL=1